MYQKFVQWFQRMTDKPYVMYVLAVIAFLESIIFPIPVDIFTFTLASAHPKRWLAYGTVATTFSVLGALGAYFLGFYLFDSFGQRLIEFYGYEASFSRVVELFDDNTFVVMFTSAFTPIPYKVFTLAGGALEVNLLPFITASILGRGLRFFAETWIPYRFGKRIALIFQKNMKRASWVFAIVVITYLLIYWFTST
jgi:membrane protein YqaA with SNARE-associated domain